MAPALDAGRVVVVGVHDPDEVPDRGRHAVGRLARAVDPDRDVEVEHLGQGLGVAGGAGFVEPLLERVHALEQPSPRPA